jgi:aryl-alcohol dehydrogenase-like predicted oxidoreductase
MDRRPLGRTGLTVSRVLLGCGSIGGIGSPAVTRGKGLSPQEGLEQIDTAVAMGINTLDTANSYGGGVSEQVVGRWITSHPDADVLVATKVGNLVRPDQQDIDLSPAHIAEQVSASLARLGRIDLYLSHAPDPGTPIEKTLEAFAAVLESGRARAIGGCNLSAAELEAALDAAERHGLPGYQWVQSEYNLLTGGSDHTDVMRIVRERDLGFTPFSPLAGGVLAGRYQRDTEPPPGSRMAVLPGSLPELDGSMWDALEAFGERARRRDVSVPALALAWVLTAPDVTAPLVAPRRPEQFADVQQALEVELDEDERAELAALFE